MQKSNLPIHRLNNDGDYTFRRGDRFLLETNVPGVFGVGDVRQGSVKRVASGVGEGSICVQFVHRHLAMFNDTDAI